MNALKSGFVKYAKFCLVAVGMLPAVRMSDLAAAESNTVSEWRKGPSDQWFVEWDKALAQAKKTKKNIFVLNTGSDWCHWCKKLRDDVLDSQEFKKFASKNLVLLYLDSPLQPPLEKDQKTHNRQVVKALEFGGGVPSATVVSPNGAKFGIVSGGGGTAKSYIERIKKALRNNRTPFKDRNTMILFKEGYGMFAEKIAAERAKFPPVAQADFRARLTGVAIVDKNMRYKPNSADFLPPETKLDVPFGKTALFRVEYDFPKGYAARVWVRAGDKQLSWYFGSNPSGLYNGKGTAYGFLSLLDRGKACTVKSVDLKTNSDPELDEFPHGWSMTNAVVDVHFMEANGEAKDSANEPSSAPRVSKSIPKGWMEDFEAAKKKAAEEGKLILMNFSGSDWCGWCMKMDKEVLGQQKFIKDVSKKYVLVMIDSPRDKSILSVLAKNQNNELRMKYGVQGYPTVVIVDSAGNEIKRHSGYRKGGVNGYMRYLKELTKDVKWPLDKNRN